jgi:hypothetical protein
VETNTITIPADFSCDNCVLQWFWDGDSDYFNCADIKINEAVVPTSVPSTSPTARATVAVPVEIDPIFGVGKEDASALELGCSVYAQGCQNGQCIDDKCVCDSGYFYMAPAGCVLQVVEDASTGERSVRFAMSITIPESKFELDRFQGAVQNFSSQMATMDWDTIKYSAAAIQSDIVQSNPGLGVPPAEASSSSSKDVAIAVVVTILLGAVLVGAVVHMQRTNANPIALPAMPLGGDAPGKKAKESWLQATHDQLTV